MVEITLFPVINGERKKKYSPFWGAVSEGAGAVKPGLNDGELFSCYEHSGHIQKLLLGYKLRHDPVTIPAS